MTLNRTGSGIASLYRSSAPAANTKDAPYHDQMYHGRRAWGARVGGGCDRDAPGHGAQAVAGRTGRIRYYSLAGAVDLIKTPAAPVLSSFRRRLPRCGNQPSIAVAAYCRACLGGLRGSSICGGSANQRRAGRLLLPVAVPIASERVIPSRASWAGAERLRGCSVSRAHSFNHRAFDHVACKLTDRSPLTAHAGLLSRSSLRPQRSEPSEPISWNSQPRTAMQ